MIVEQGENIPPRRTPRQWLEERIAFWEKELVWNREDLQRNKKANAEIKELLKELRREIEG